LDKFVKLKIRYLLYILDVLKDEHWIFTMHDELNHVVRIDVWIPAPRTKNMNVIGTNEFLKIK